MMNMWVRILMCLLHRWSIARTGQRKDTAPVSMLIFCDVSLCGLDFQIEQGRFESDHSIFLCIVHGEGKDVDHVGKES